MNLRIVREHLAEAERHLAQSDRHIARQVELIDGLERGGHPTGLGARPVGDLSSRSRQLCRPLQVHSRWAIALAHKAMTP